MKKKNDVKPQISMDLSDLNFDWEEDDAVENNTKKKKSHSDRPRKEFGESRGNYQTDYALDDVEKKGNEVPIMTFDELNSIGGAPAAAEVAEAAVETAETTVKEAAVEAVVEKEAVEEALKEAAGEVVAEIEVEAEATDAEVKETAETADAEKADESAGSDAAEEASESANAEKSEAEDSEKTENTENAEDEGESGKNEVAETKDGEEKPKPKKKKKKKEEEEEERPLWKEILELFIYLVAVFIVSYLIVLFVGQRTIVEGSSMNPTLVDGDNLIVDKISYRFSDPQRFDVIVFPYQHAKHTYYIKRIIALPGETIRIDENGTIYINGNVLNENYGNEVIEKPGRAYEEIVLGPDEYFVMGDNRNNSSDSRDVMVGNVHRKDFIGKAWLRIYPFNKFGLVQHARDEK